MQYDNYNRARRNFPPKITLDRYEAEGLLSAADRKLIAAYVNHKKASSKRSTGRRADYASMVLAYWRQWLKASYSEATILDLEEAITNFKDSKTKKGLPYAQNTQNDYIIILKSFYYWLIDQEYSSIKEKQIKSIHAPGINRHTTLPENKLLDVDLLEMLKNTLNPMRRAFLVTGWEAGTRPEELCASQWKDLVQDEYGYKFYITDFKTNKPRFARLTKAAPYLADWKAVSERTGPEDYIFITQYLTPMAYTTGLAIITEAKMDAEIKKRVTLYSLRKGRINDMYAKKFPPNSILYQIWNNLNSKMPASYITDSEEEKDQMILEHQGLLKEADKKPDALAKIPCPYCHANNSPTAHFCDQCRRPLSVERLDENVSLARVNAEQMATDVNFMRDTLKELQKILAANTKTDKN